MEITRLDEQSLHQLYLEYKNARDNVPYSHYQPIFEAADQLLEMQNSLVKKLSQSEQQIIESGISSICAQLEHTYSAEVKVDTEHSEQSAPVPHRPAIQFKDILSQFRSTVDNIREWVFGAHWMTTAATACVVVGVLVMANPISHRVIEHNTDFITTQVDALSEDGDLVLEEIFTLNESQYGFIDTKSDFAKAFTAGVLLVDLMSLSDLTDTNVKRPIIRKLTSSLPASYDVDEEALLTLSQQELSELQFTLQDEYAKENSASAFMLGQWVEVTYLQSKISRISNRVEQLQTSIGNIDSVLIQLESEKQTTRKIASDLNDIKQISMEDRELLSKKLLNLRTILMM